MRYELGRIPLADLAIRTPEANAGCNVEVPSTIVDARLLRKGGLVVKPLAEPGVGNLWATAMRAGNCFSWKAL